jgi:hypothetical protein
MTAISSSPTGWHDGLRHLAHVGCGRDAGADVEELADGRFGGQIAHRAARAATPLTVEMTRA